jgi:2-phosphoglycerate kinase
MQTNGHEPTADAPSLREQLRNVYWIGGGSGGGKSTIARHLAAEHGLLHFATDDVMADHSRRSTPEDCPLLHHFLAMDMDQRWVNCSPKEMLETFHWFHGEGFSMIIEDILHLPGEPGVIVDGFRLLPHLVKPLLAVPAQAVWLLPTPDFRQAVFNSRGWPQSGFTSKTSDPERAYSNLLERDALFTRRLHDQAKRLGLNTIEIDTTMTVDESAGQVAKAFRL